MEVLTEAPTEEYLWDCIVAFQHYPFRTVTGLAFSYTLKIGRNGKYTKELFIARWENIKSLVWSSVRMVFEKLEEMKGVVFIRPKELANVQG